MALSVSLPSFGSSRFLSPYYCLVTSPSSSVTREMLRCSCFLLPYKPVVAAAAAMKQESPGGAPPSIRRARTAFVSVAVARNETSDVQNEKPVTISGAGRQSVATVYSAPLTDLGRRLGLRPNPELGFLSLLFVLLTAVGAIISLALISIPTVRAFKRLAASVDKLVQLVSEEVPGTLSSLRLSGLEINDLAQQLSNLRQKISGNRYNVKNGRKQ